MDNLNNNTLEENSNQFNRKTEDLMKENRALQDEELNLASILENDPSTLLGNKQYQNIKKRRLELENEISNRLRHSER